MSAESNFSPMEGSTQEDSVSSASPPLNPLEAGEAGEKKGDGPYSHAVYHQISQENGRINRMNKQQMRDKLRELGLDSRGMKEVLKKRLKSYYKRQKLAHAQVRPPGSPHYDYLLVIDFEATCEEYNGAHYKHEIIEFPVILVDAHRQEVVDEFHSYVRPLVNASLTPFCTQLTGITQAQVDRAPTFSEVLVKMEAWMDKYQLGNGKTYAVVTDGPWDMSRFMHIQCQLSRVPFPRWAQKWVNLRKWFCNFYKFKRAKLNTMLENLGLTFVGHQHSGIDDTRNITRIVIRMLEDGCNLRTNEQIFPQRQSGMGRPSKTDSDSSAEDSAKNHGGDDLCANVNGLNLNCEETQETGGLPYEDGEIDDLMSYYAIQHS